ncbi:MAG: hypothetical protein ABSC03_10440 [Verrucomicrobiota bacterium]|jgi:hypothetical protein
MPSEFSLYRKIQVVLETARGVNVTSLVELRREIILQRAPNFLTKQYDKEHDSFVQEVSRRGVRRTVNICGTLRLIDERGDLSEAGRRALRRTVFDRILTEQIHKCLEDNRLGPTMLNAIIAKGLRSNPVVMPTTAELWEEAKTEVPLLLFSQMLTLLAQCGSADSSQRKIYLHFKE